MSPYPTRRKKTDCYGCGVLVVTDAAAVWLSGFITAIRDIVASWNVYRRLCAFFYHLKGTIDVARVLLSDANGSKSTSTMFLVP